VGGQDRDIIMNGSTNGWQLLCIVVLLTTAATAIGAAQSTETTANATETSLTTTTADNGTVTRLQSPAQVSRSDQAADNVPENATPIEVGERVTGRLPVGDQDWTQFSLESGGELTISVTARNETNMSAFIYSGENLLESTYVDPGERVTLTVTADSAGQYYVFVRNEANATAGTYAFEVSKSDLTTSEPTEEPAGNADGNGNGLGFWTLALLGAVILVGYLAFRGEGEDEEEGANEGEEADEEEGANEGREEENRD
jgi:hypothetical protein